MAEREQTDEMYAGNTHVQRFVCVDRDQAPTAGVYPAYDFTSKTVKWALTQIDEEGNYLTSPTVLEKATGGSGITFEGAATLGVALVALAAADTDDFTPGDYHFELEVFDVSGGALVLADGTLTIRANVVNA